MKWEAKYEMLVTDLPHDIEYHDDMHDEEVKIKPFFKHKYFRDFRIFNGIPLGEMDNLLVGLAETMNNIERVHNNGFE